MNFESAPAIIYFTPAIIGIGGGFFILIFSVPIYFWPPKPGGLIRAAGENWVRKPEHKTAILRHTARGANVGAVVMILIGIASLFMNLSENQNWIIPLCASPLIIIIPSIHTLSFARKLKKAEEQENIDKV
jgi:hypothetical protein